MGTRKRTHKITCYLFYFIFLTSPERCSVRLIPREGGITTTLTVSTQQTLLQEEQSENDIDDRPTTEDGSVMLEDYDNNTNRVTPQFLSTSTSTTQRTDHVDGDIVLPQTSTTRIENSISTPRTNEHTVSFDAMTVEINDFGLTAQHLPVTVSLSKSNINMGAGFNSDSVDHTSQLRQLSDLLETVLSDYDPRLRPIQVQQRPVVIKSDFVMINLIDFDTQEQRFSIMGYYRMEWKDDFLTWRPSIYGNTRYLRIPVNNLWIPKLTYSKARYGNGLVGHRSSDVALVHNSGVVRWVPEGIYDLVCGVDITFYPFDIQVCSLSYFIADEDQSTIELQLSQEVDPSEYIENAQWELVNVTAEQKLVGSTYLIQYNFTLERRAGFTLFTMMVPLIMLSALSGTTFLIPIDSGEKCCFAVTIFLSYGIFETIVIETLPKNSLNVSYVVIFTTFLLACSTLLVFYTIVQAKFLTMMGDGLLSKTWCMNSGSITTYTTYMRKIDSIVFVVYMTGVIGITSFFIKIMMDRKQIFDT